MNANDRKRRIFLGLAISLAALLVLGLVVGGSWMINANQKKRNEKQQQDSTAAVIRQLQTAIDNFKSKFHSHYIPSAGGGPNDTFRLRGTYHRKPTGSQVGQDSPEAIYLISIFPYLNLSNTGLPDADYDCNQILAFFLTGGRVTNYSGFSLNKSAPFGTGGERFGPFLDFPADRFDSDGRLLDPQGTPFAYFAFDPTINSYPPNAAFTWNGTTVVPYTEVGKHIKQKGRQIISAGRDRRFGPGGDWKPGSGPWAEGGPGADDLSNFNYWMLATRDY